jgi:hypothetical protein
MHSGKNMSKDADTPLRTTWEAPNAVQIHVALDDIEPAIWRRLVVPLHVTLVQLHHILQAAVGWTDAHLHEFETGGLNYGDLDMLDANLIEDDAQAFGQSHLAVWAAFKEYGISVPFPYRNVLMRAPVKVAVAGQ